MNTDGKRRTPRRPPVRAAAAGGSVPGRRRPAPRARIAMAGPAATARATATRRKEVWR